LFDAKAAVVDVIVHRVLVFLLFFFSLVFAFYLVLAFLFTKKSL